jgi:hypothetical protein
MLAAMNAMPMIELQGYNCIDAIQFALSPAGSGLFQLPTGDVAHS